MWLSALLGCGPGVPPDAVPSVAPFVLPEAPDGPLQGWVIAVSPGHGKLLFRFADGITPYAWGYQRDPMNGMREDDWTLSFTDRFLAPALEAQGATVLSLRERDRNAVSMVEPKRVVGLREARTGRAGQTAHRVDGDGHAVWMLPQAGRVYTRWVSAADQGVAHYVLDGRRVDVDQRHSGGVWWPLGTIDGPTELRLSGEGSPLSMGEVRVGGGEYHAKIRELGIEQRLPFAEVAAVHSLEALGGPESLLMLDNGEFISDMRFRARWSTWALEGLSKTAFLSIHSNAGGGQGSSVFVGVDSDVDPPLEARPRARALRDAVMASLQTRLVEAEPGWLFHDDVEGNYSEISPYWNGLDAALIEVGHHDKAFDAKRLTDPEFQRVAAEAIALGVAAFAHPEQAP